MAPNLVSRALIACAAGVATVWFVSAFWLVALSHSPRGSSPANVEGGAHRDSRSFVIRRSPGKEPSACRSGSFVRTETAHDAGLFRRACQVFCDGPLLAAVQTARIFNDSKTFVDMPLRQDPEVVLADFQGLGRKDDPEVLRRFVSEHFDAAGAEMLPWLPPDWDDRPSRLAAIGDVSMRQWALALNSLWKVLGRKQRPELRAFLQRHTALPRRFGMVVPGGRFRETYYWDTYWIVRGLLICGMTATARGVVENLLDDVRAFGFVPNGGRIYYLDRSQPPFLSEMVLEIHKSVPNRTWLASVLPVLAQEYEFWMDPKRGHAVHVASGSAGKLVLNVYRSSSQKPRPESFFEDVETAKEAHSRLDRAQETMYNEIASGAETGWDFSSRWTAAGRKGSADLATINTTAVIPVDLNSILYRVELNLAKISEALEDDTCLADGVRYRAAAARRARAIKELLWVDARSAYRDYRLDTGAASAVTSLSDFAAPLWAGLVDGISESARLVEALQDSGLLQPGGAATTTLATGQQWDWPNAWPPLQLMLIEGLEMVGAQAFADRLASEWIRSASTAWNRTGFMFEKYNASSPGTGGGGGEYTPQVGFGWTNGVALSLIIRQEEARVQARVGG